MYCVDPPHASWKHFIRKTVNILRKAKKLCRTRQVSHDFQGSLYTDTQSERVSDLNLKFPQKIKISFRNQRQLKTISQHKELFPESFIKVREQTPPESNRESSHIDQHNGEEAECEFMHVIERDVRREHEQDVRIEDEYRTQTEQDRVEMKYELSDSQFIEQDVDSKGDMEIELEVDTITNPMQNRDIQELDRKGSEQIQVETSIRQDVEVWDYCELCDEEFLLSNFGEWCDHRKERGLDVRELAYFCKICEEEYCDSDLNLCEHVQQKVAQKGLRLGEEWDELLRESWILRELSKQRGEALEEKVLISVLVKN